MDLKSKIGRYEFVAEPFHVDFTARLTMGVLGNHLLNCAGFHAAERGFGMVELNENHYTWVLSRLAVEMNRMPEVYEKFVVETWVENAYRLFTDRNFAILDMKGNPMGYARSVWAMISMETRKPADLFALYGDGIAAYVCDKACPIAKAGRIRIGQRQPECVYMVRYSDIDLNGHVNSIKYIEHILDLFPLNLLKLNTLHRFEVAYVAESHYGDTLHFCHEKKSEGEYDVEIRKNGTDTVVRSKLIFH